MRFKEILQSGLWPFTPDPIPEGIYVIGNPPDDAPILVTTNSRHTLSQLRRILSPIGGRVLAIDMGGVDIHSALASGRWSFEKISAALEAMSQEKDASLSPGPRQRATVEHQDPITVILTYPVWDALGGLEIGEIKGFRFIAGPANACHLPAYFARGCQFAEGMQILNFPYRDRLSLSLAHAGIFCLVAALPWLLFGWRVLAVGIWLTLGSAVFWAMAAEQVWRIHQEYKRLAFGCVVVLFVLLTGAYFLHLVSLSPLLWIVSTLTTAHWMTRCIVLVSGA